eukprot:XP_001709690.1 Hypothetical protein GL50803_32470 [Giardia lamblia ATCC 50803]
MHLPPAFSMRERAVAENFRAQMVILGIVTRRSSLVTVDATTAILSSLLCIRCARRLTERTGLFVLERQRRFVRTLVKSSPVFSYTTLNALCSRRMYGFGDFGSLRSTLRFLIPVFRSIPMLLGGCS